MGLLDFLGSLTPQGAAAEVAKGAAEGVLAGAGQLAKDIKEVWTGEASPETRAKLAQIQMQADLLFTQAQNAVNEAEAKSGSVFVAGWRPAIGWTCAMSLWMYYVPRFAMATILWSIAIYHNNWQWIAPPEVGIGDILGLVASMMGMGAMRSYEKKIGVAK
jgi:hypothetical protein